MNERSDIERVLRQWMADPPVTMPDRVVDVVAARIAVNRQRRVVRLPGRKAAMHGRTLSYLVGAAAVVAIAVAGIAFIAGRPGVSSPAPPASPTITPSPSPSASVAAWWLHGIEGCGSCLGVLPPGTQRSSALQPGLTYTIPTGWVNNYDRADAFELIPDTAANRALIEGDAPTAFYLSINDNMRVSLTDCSTNSQGGFAPDEVVNAIAGRPGLSVSAPVPATVGGLSGEQIDLAVEAGWTGTCPDSGDLPSVATFTNGQAHWWAVQGERKRVIVLTNPAAGNLLIEIAGPADGFDAFASQAMSIVNSFQFNAAP